MKRLCLVSSIVVMTLGMSAQAGPTTYCGSLTSEDGGIQGTAGWVGDPDHHVTFQWTVTQNPDRSWHYHYELNSLGLKGELSHLVLETSLSFTANDIYNDVPGVEASDPKWHTEANGNPHIPEGVFGVRFDDLSGPVVTMAFDSRRNPVWGDFFGKSGRHAGQVWNAGLTSPDFDPMAAAQSGSLADHVLVPDTVISNPAPGAFLLGALGTGLVGQLRRRKTL